MFHEQNYKAKIFLLILYFLSITGMELFVFQKQTNASTNLFMLWLSIIIAFLTILSGIMLKLKWSVSFVQILIITFILNIIFIPRTGLFGTDANFDYNLINLIDKFGWNAHLDSLAPWPMIHLFIDITSKIIGISLLDGSRYLPSITSTLVLFFLFCLNKRINKNYLVPIISLFLFSTIIYRPFFQSTPLRENFGYFFIFAGLYCQLVGLEVKDARFKFLSIFFGLVLIISHHLSTFIYLVYLISLTLSQNLYNIVKKYNYFSERYSQNMSYLLLILVSTLSYWIIVNIFIFNKLVISLINFLSFGEISTKSSILYIYPRLIDIEPLIFKNSPRVTFILTLLLIIIYVYQNYNTLNQYDFSIFIFVFITGIEWLFLTFNIIDIDVYPERIQLFSWTFLLIFLSKILYEYIGLRGVISGKKIIAFLFIISFAIMNFTQVYPFQYDPGVQPPYEYGMVREFHLPQEYLSIAWFNTYTNQTIDDGLIQTDRNLQDLLPNIERDKLVTKEEFFRSNSSLELDNTHWAIIRMEMFKRIIGTSTDNAKIKEPLNLSENTYGMINEKMTKVYTNREVDIYSKPFIRFIG